MKQSIFRIKLINQQQQQPVEVVIQLQLNDSSQNVLFQSKPLIANYSPNGLDPNEFAFAVPLTTANAQCKPQLLTRAIVNKVATQPVLVGITLNTDIDVVLNRVKFKFSVTRTVSEIKTAKFYQVMSCQLKISEMMVIEYPFFQSYYIRTQTDSYSAWTKLSHENEQFFLSIPVAVQGEIVRTTVCGSCSGGQLIDISDLQIFQTQTLQPRQNEINGEYRPHAELVQLISCIHAAEELYNQMQAEKLASPHVLPQFYYEDYFRQLSAGLQCNYREENPLKSENFTQTQKHSRHRIQDNEDISTFYNVKYSLSCTPELDLQLGPTEILAGCALQCLAVVVPNRCGTVIIDNEIEINFQGQEHYESPTTLCQLLQAHFVRIPKQFNCIKFISTDESTEFDNNNAILRFSRKQIYIQLKTHKISFENTQTNEQILFEIIKKSILDKREEELHQIQLNDQKFEDTQMRDVSIQKDQIETNKQCIRQQLSNVDGVGTVYRQADHNKMMKFLIINGYMDNQYFPDVFDDPFLVNQYKTQIHKQNISNEQILLAQSCLEFLRTDQRFPLCYCSLSQRSSQTIELQTPRSKKSKLEIEAVEEQAFESIDEQLYYYQVCYGSLHGMHIDGKKLQIQNQQVFRFSTNGNIYCGQKFVGNAFCLKDDNRNYIIQQPSILCGQLLVPETKMVYSVGSLSDEAGLLSERLSMQQIQDLVINRNSYVTLDSVGVCSIYNLIYESQHLFSICYRVNELGVLISPDGDALGQIQQLSMNNRLLFEQILVLNDFRQFQFSGTTLKYQNLTIDLTHCEINNIPVVSGCFIRDNVLINEFDEQFSSVYFNKMRYGCDGYVLKSNLYTKENLRVCHVSDLTDENGARITDSYSIRQQQLFSPSNTKICDLKDVVDENNDNIDSHSKLINGFVISPSGWRTELKHLFLHQNNGIHIVHEMFRVTQRGLVLNNSQKVVCNIKQLSYRSQNVFKDITAQQLLNCVQILNNTVLFNQNQYKMSLIRFNAKQLVLNPFYIENDRLVDQNGRIVGDVDKMYFKRIRMTFYKGLQIVGDWFYTGDYRKICRVHELTDKIQQRVQVE